MEENNTETYRRPALPNRPKSLGLKGTFYWNKGPRAPWDKAVSASLTIGIPFMIGALFNHMDWAMLASMGGFTALYVHNETYSERARKLFFVLIGLLLSFGLGLASSDSPFTMTMAFVLVSALSTFFSHAFKMPPPGGYFFVLVCAVGTIIPFEPSQIPFRLSVAFLGGALAWLIAMSGWLWKPFSQEKFLVSDVYRGLGRFMESIGTTGADLEKHNLLLTLQSAEEALLKVSFKKNKLNIKVGYLLNLIEKANDIFLAVIEAEGRNHKPFNRLLIESVHEIGQALITSEGTALTKLNTFETSDPVLSLIKEELNKASDIITNRIPINTPVFQRSENNVWHVLRSSFSKPSGVLPATFRIAIAILVASLLSILFGNARPYWVTLACASALQGATVWAIVNRTFQRSIGTAIGILIGGLILFLNVNNWELVLVVMALQFVIELLVVRNYTVAVTFITPMALIITHFSGVQWPVLTLIGARLVDTLLGTAVALLAGLFLWHKTASSRLPMIMKLTIRLAGDLLQDLMKEEDVDEDTVVKKRKQLLNLLIVLRRTYDGALNEIRKSQWIDSYWSSVIAMQRLGALIGSASRTNFGTSKTQDQMIQVKTAFEILYQDVDHPQSLMTVPSILDYPGIQDEIKALHESLQMIQHD